MTGACQNITFIQLMSMNSGIIPIDSCSGLTDSWQNSYCMSEMESEYPGGGDFGSMLGYFINAPLQSSPGSAYDYSNPNFWLLSYLVQKLSGELYNITTI